MTRVTTLLTALIITVSGGHAPADDAKKEVTLTGTLVCGKCKLKEPGKCANVLQVKEGDKTVDYYLEDKGNKERYHEAVCGGDQKPGVTVTGTVTEKGGKKWVRASKIEVK